jgi:pyruvate kinase
VETADVRTFQEMVRKACRLAVQEGFAGPGSKLVVTAGVPFGTPGATNVLRIAWVD